MKINCNARIQYSEELGLITIDAVSDSPLGSVTWKEVSIKKDNPVFDSLLEVYKANPYVKTT